MVIDENYERRVRIIGKPGDVVGLAMEVRDFETGEMIENVFRIEILLDANEENTARLHYHEFDKTGRIVTGKDLKPIKKAVTVRNSEIDITAFEVTDHAYSVSN